jgi:hypothetical protein
LYNFIHSYPQVKKYKPVLDDFTLSETGFLESAYLPFFGEALLLPLPDGFPVVDGQPAPGLETGGFLVAILPSLLKVSSDKNNTPRYA